MSLTEAVITTGDAIAEHAADHRDSRFLGDADLLHLAALDRRKQQNDVTCFDKYIEPRCLEHERTDHEPLDLQGTQTPEAQPPAHSCLDLRFGLYVIGGSG